MLRLLKNLYSNLFFNWFQYSFYNHFVTHLPFWNVRKLLYKIGGMKIGKQSRIQRNVIIDYPKGISIGDNSYINERCYLDGRGCIEIGNNVSISIFSKIVTSGHNVNSNDFSFYKKPVQICDCVWMATGSTVLGGGILPRGCVLCAGALVPEDRKDLIENGVYAGVPIKLVSERQCDVNFCPGVWTPLFR